LLYCELDQIFRRTGDNDAVGMSLVAGLAASPGSSIRPGGSR
jgi:hypothetical protein